MKQEDFYKAQDILRRINIIECVITHDTIDDKVLDKLDVPLREQIRADITAFTKKGLIKMKNELEKEFNAL
ncbi:hypothetical protein [Niabella aurantiaca]|uniref:hypothetical protein n=1 Tax=Niabella aurantiaca TaxID=379900 RepID=UPI0003800C0F|nr:hypothetical protein [Niabella aurantiaca]